MPEEAFIAADRVRCNAEASSRKQALEQLSQMLADSPAGLTAAEICGSMNQRERLGSTCLGNGAALPHCRFAAVSAPMGALLLLRRPIDFDGDDTDVTIVLGVLLPESGELAELKPLADTLRLPGKLDELRELNDPRVAAEFVNQQLAASTGHAS